MMTLTQKHTTNKQQEQQQQNKNHTHDPDFGSCRPWVVDVAALPHNHERTMHFQITKADCRLPTEILHPLLGDNLRCAFERCIACFVSALPPCIQRTDWRQRFIPIPKEGGLCQSARNGRGKGVESEYQKEKLFSILLSLTVKLRYASFFQSIIGHCVV